METPDDANRSLHIVMFPWLAFGHMMPFFELSKSLAKTGNRISFISTPRNIQRLPKIPLDLAPLLHFVELQLPQDKDNLPDQAEATSDLPFHKVEYLKKAFDGLQSPLANFLQTSSPDWIVYDFMHHWLPPIAAKFGVRRVYFSIFNASTLSFIVPPSDESTLANPEDFTVLAKWIPFENNLAFKLFEIMRIATYVTENVSGVSDTFRLASTVHGCDIVAVRSCNELEPEWLNLLQERIYKKPVLPIGLLPPRVKPQQQDEKWLQIKEWLDGQETKSVVYVAFGSEVILSEEEATELALGLELSKLPFFWVLRTPVGSTESVLPNGFEDRVKGRGFICRTWAPQLRILSHPCLGGFLTHSGWSSVIESLAFGCPLLLLPFINDQPLVARYLVWNKIAIEIPRNESNGSFTMNSVAESLRKLIVEEGGESYREKATQLKEVVADTVRHDKYIDDFAQCLQEFKK